MRLRFGEKPVKYLHIFFEIADLPHDQVTELGTMNNLKQTVGALGAGDTMSETSDMEGKIVRMHTLRSYNASTWA